MKKNKVLTLVALMAVAAVSVHAQEEPPLEEVLHYLDLLVRMEDEVIGYGPTQGIFVPTAETIEVLLVAKHSFQTQPATSVVRAGYYPFRKPQQLRLLLEAGPEAGDQTNPTGLPAEPLGKIYFKPVSNLIGFYVQSANFNPKFSPNGETVYTQNELNKRIPRFNNPKKVRVFPYKTKYGVRENWYVFCWEFSTNNDFQDLVTVVRGIKPLFPPRPKDFYEIFERDSKQITMRLNSPLSMISRLITSHNFF